MGPRALLLSALLAFGWSACSENGRPPETADTPVFPEIEDMMLVAPDRAMRGNFNDPQAVFFIDRFEVTNREYAEFLRQTGYKPDDAVAFLSNWNLDPSGGYVPEQGMEDLPVTFVNFHDALAFAERTGKRLPTIEQWLRGAMGNASSKNYPWGRDFDVFYCNTLRARIHAPARVGTFENGKSDWGCYDMIGNVAEWTGTPVESYVTPSYYVMGGSWRMSDRGSARNRKHLLSLDMARRNPAKDGTYFPHELPGNRNNALGFRCVRDDAVAFIRETLTSRIASLSPDHRVSAFDELKNAGEPVYSVLKLLEFEALSRNISAPPSPAVVRLLRSPGLAGLPKLLLCYDRGVMGLYTLNGVTLWTRRQDEGEGAFGYTVVDQTESGPARIILQSKWEEKSLLSVMYPQTGEMRWGIRGPGEVRHLKLVEGTRGLLVDWHVDDRFEKRPSQPLNPPWDPLDFFSTISFHAKALLTQDALLSSIRLARLGFFVEPSAAEAIEDDSLFEVTRFKGMPFQTSHFVAERFWIQLVWGGYDNLDELLAPGSILTLYDLDTGKVQWTQDFPGALFGFQGFIVRDPLILKKGSLAALELMEESAFEPGRFKTRLGITLVDLADGSVVNHYDLDEYGESLSSWTALENGSRDFMGIVDSRKLLFFDGDQRGIEGVFEQTWRDLLEGVDEAVYVDEEGISEPLEKTSALWEELEDGGGLAFLELFSFEPSLDSWLMTRPDRRERCLLFCGLGESGFRKVFVLKGGFNRYSLLAHGQDGKHRYVLVWDSVGNLLCFDHATLNLRWKKNVGYITDRDIALSDLDGDGAPEGMIATLSGEILVIELEGGDTVHYLRRIGSTFSHLFPVETEGGKGQEIFCWIKDQGIYLLDTDLEPATEEERNLRFTVREMERWRSGNPGR